MVSTYVWQPKYGTEAYSKVLKEWKETCDEIEELGEEGNMIMPSKPPNTCIWRGPICIDNMSEGSSLGDQFAARAFALLNDTMTIKMVNTIKRYLIAPENTNRKDFDEMLRVQNK